MAFHGKRNLGIFRLLCILRAFTELWLNVYLLHMLINTVIGQWRRQLWGAAWCTPHVLSSTLSIFGNNVLQTAGNCKKVYNNSVRLWLQRLSICPRHDLIVLRIACVSKQAYAHCISLRL